MSALDSHPHTSTAFYRVDLFSGNCPLRTMVSTGIHRRSHQIPTKIKLGRGGGRNQLCSS
jgi:hypothetical protein